MTNEIKRSLNYTTKDLSTRKTLGLVRGNNND